MEVSLQGFMDFHGVSLRNKYDQYIASLNKPIQSDEVLRKDNIDNITENMNNDVDNITNTLKCIKIEDKSQTKGRKCGICNNYGHNRRTCPQNLEKSQKNIEVENIKVENIKVENIKVEKKINIEKKLETNFDESSGLDKCFKCNNTSSNNQFCIVDSHKYCFLCYKLYLDDLNMNNCEDCNSNPCDCDTESLSDDELNECNDLLAEDTNNYIYYEGVSYGYDQSTNIVDYNYEELGEWNSDCECIEWYNEECYKIHEENKKNK